ncbi:uncharacterized protein TRIADDRAFT_60315 [Trichoplax adhaerens]|uniref:Uncharacterized protein n=1 Tax=Trichoplax adhaerens TaxID=10228 RepID=B3S7W1_TRIAD|nr:predicted protein [Trichoplax adhaerens]EDV21364.1 predicted protein [Trichoplax adhaerens]|eukprot:XP_002116331.1 predicted protein [Trichoplax adhaerens]
MSFKYKIITNTATFSENSSIDRKQSLSLTSYQPKSYIANIKPKYFLYGVGAEGNIKWSKKGETQLNYYLHDGKTDEVVVDGQITDIEESLQIEQPSEYHSYEIKVRPNDLGHTYEVLIPQHLCFAVSGIKDAIRSKYDDYMAKIDNKWLSKTARFQLDYLLPAYVDETLIVKSWSNPDRNEVKSLIMRGEQCLSSFTINFDPQREFTPGRFDPDLDIISLDSFHVKFNSPHLFYFSDRFKQSDVSKLLYVFLERFEASLRLGVFDFNVLASKYSGTLMIVANTGIINPALYDLPPNTMIKQSMRMTSIGKSSCILTFEFYDILTEQLVLSYDNVCIFMKNGKLETFPEAYKKKMLEEVPTRVSDEGVMLLFKKVPENHYTYKVKTRSSDVDYNNHIGYAGIFGFCLDTASSAISSNSSCYKYNFGKDFNPRCIRQKSVSFFREIHLDSEVTIKTWQAEDKNSLFFSVEKGSKCVCQVEFVVDI